MKISSHFCIAGWLLAGSLGASAVSCSKAPQGDGMEAGSAFPVQVAKPFFREIQVSEILTGRFEPVESVNLRSRVSGYVEAVHFEEGAEVQEGDLMFQIDPRPFQARVDAAEARVQEAEARLEFATSRLKRIADLVSQGSVSQEEADLRRSNEAEAMATLHAAEAERTAAQLDLEFTSVKAPIAGIADRYLVTPGNFISGGNPSADLLTTIIPHHPIHCVFEIDERRILEFTRMYMRGEVEGRGGESPPVEIAVSDSDEFEFTGTIDFFSNRLDSNTATSEMRAIIQNEDKFLTPGLFGRVKLPIGSPFEAMLVRDEALGFDQAKRFAWVLGEDNTVSRRFVEVGPLEGGFRVIESGLEETDRLVVTGIQILQNGMPVAPTEVSMDPDQAAEGGPSAASEESADEALKSE